MASLFVTGARGLVGRALLRSLPGGAFNPVACLTRDRESLTRTIPPRSGWRYIEGDLDDTASWVHALPGHEVALHLAAATGKASEARLRAVNVEGTRRLLEESRCAGLRRFILVSSIAARFRNRASYHYAESKIEAETLVRSSGLDYAIVRPTMIFGPGSAVLDGLARLAGAPLGVVFGSGQVKVQPVAVQDVARVLITTAQRHSLDATEFEVGGPEVLPMEELIRRIRTIVKGGSGRLLHVPIEPLRASLAVLQRWVGPALPLTAGQLASFANDGTAAPHPWVEPFIPQMQSIDAMLRESLRGG